MEVIIPTRNDYTCLGNICESLSLLKIITKIHVVNNGSNHEIAQIIKKICKDVSKCIYYECPVTGKGAAISMALCRTLEDVLFVDADIIGFNLEMVTSLFDPLSKGYDLVKAKFTRSNGQSNSSFVLDELRKRFPALSICKPTGGIYCASRRVIQDLTLPKSWSVDLSILLQAHKKGFAITEVNIGIVRDKVRDNESLEFSKKCLLEEVNKFSGVSNAGN